MYKFYPIILGSLLLGGTLGASRAEAQSKTLSGLATGWTQNAPYNAGCPKSSTKVPAKVGSAALALSQILRFNGAKYDFPPTGLGTRSYTDKTPDVTGTYSANFATTSYPWSKLPATLKAADTNVSTLLYHAGVSLSEDYGTAGSYVPKFDPTVGYAKPADAVKLVQTSLVSYFGYSGGSIVSNGGANGALSATTLLKIKADIDAGFPIVVALTGESGGQFAVVNGYSGTKLNFLFGLGGGDGLYDAGKIAVKYKEGTTARLGTFNGISAFLVGIRPPVVPSVSIADAKLTEGNASSSKMKFLVSIPKATKWPVSVTVKTSKGTAAPPTDYTETTGTVVIPAAKTSTYFEVPVLGDLTLENDETFFATATAGKLPVARPKATGTILNDDASASVANVEFVEGNSGTTAAYVPITLSRAITSAVTFSYSTTDGTAKAGDDYTTTTGTVTIPAGQTKVNIPLSIKGEIKREANENFTVKITGPVTITQNTAIVTIRNDDEGLSVSNPVLNESDYGRPSADFVLTLTGALSAPLTVSYNTAEDTAAALNDFEGTSGTVTFAPGETTKTISVPVIGDKREESDETFKLVVTSDQIDVGNNGVATIRDDDATLSVTPLIEVVEGVSTQTITVQMSRALTIPITINYATADSTATAGNDYTSTSGTLSFPAGTTQATISVSLLDDQTGEGTETFYANFNSPELEESAQTRFNILDNDAGLIADPASQREGDTTARNINFVVRLTNSFSQRVTVSFATVDGTAKAGIDYTAKTGTVVFEPGETSKSIAIGVLPDTVVESDETLGLQLTATGISAPTDPIVGVIQDDDFTLSVADVTVNEGNAGPVNATFTIKMSKAVTFPVDINYYTNEGTAKYTTDFDQKNDNFTFAPGETEKTVNIVVFGDTVDEVNETFSLTVQTGYYYGDEYRTTVANATIVDDDDPKSPLTGRIVFSANGASRDIYAANPDGTNLTRLTFTDDVDEVHPLISPNGQKIAFLSNNALWTMDASGNNQHRVAYPVYDIGFKWSPDSSKLVYVNGNTSQVYTINADESGATQITTTAQAQNPRFTPDGAKILYENYIDSHYDLYSITTAGKSNTRLTRNGGINAYYNAAGTKIVYESNDEIYVMNADGTSPVRLTNNTTADNSPRFTPDGTRILFWSRRTGKYGLFKSTLDGVTQTSVLEDNNFNGNWSISPNSGWVAYDTYDSASGGYIVRLKEIDGGDPRILPTILDSDYEPDWGSFSVTTPPTTLPIGSLSGKLVYDSRGRIRTSNADGSNELTVSSAGSYPVFTPDATGILFSNNGLNLSDAVGNTIDSVSGGADSAEFAYAANADKSKVYFLADNSVKAYDTATGDITTLFSTEDYHQLYSLRLSADGTKVFFQMYIYVENEGYLTNIYSVPTTGGSVTRLTTGNDDRLMAINPGTGQVAYRSYYYDNGSRYQLLAMSADGSNSQPIYNSDQDILRAAYSPDSTKVAIALADGSLYSGSPSGIGLSKIFNEVADYGLTFSPDSTKIAVSTQYGFWIVTADGTGRMRFTSRYQFDWKSGSVSPLPIKKAPLKAAPAKPKKSSSAANS